MLENMLIILSVICLSSLVLASVTGFILASLEELKLQKQKKVDQGYTTPSNFTVIIRADNDPAAVIRTAASFNRSRYVKAETIVDVTNADDITLALLHRKGFRTASIIRKRDVSGGYVAYIDAGIVADSDFLYEAVRMLRYRTVIYPDTTYFSENTLASAAAAYMQAASFATGKLYSRTVGRERNAVYKKAAWFGDDKKRVGTGGRLFDLSPGSLHELEKVTSRAYRKRLTDEVSSLKTWPLAIIRLINLLVLPVFLAYILSIALFFHENVFLLSVMAAFSVLMIASILNIPNETLKRKLRLILWLPAFYPLLMLHLLARPFYMFRPKTRQRNIFNKHAPRRSLFMKAGL